MAHGGPWDALWVGLFLIGAVVGPLAWRRLRDHPAAYLTTGDSVAAHVVMNLAMAVMATPAFVPPVPAVLAIGVGLLAAGFAALLIRGMLAPTAGRRARRGAEAYHLVAAAAMVAAITGLAGWPATVLAVLFAIDAAGTVLLLAAFPERALATAGATATRVRVGQLWLAAVPHVIMDVGMVWMLVR